MNIKASVLLLLMSSLVSAAEWKSLEIKFTPGLVRGKELVLLPAGILGRLDKSADIRDNVWHLAGDNGLLFKGVLGKNLPKKNFTASALVSLKAMQQWGGIIGSMQDNGSYERGWLLGYNERTFTFYFSTGGSHHKIEAKEAIKTGQFYHVAVTFDGKKATLYVNGELAGEKSISGEIKYDDDTPLTIGTYRDKDENYGMQGSLGQVSLIKKVLSRAAIKKEAATALASLPQKLAFSGVPIATYTSPDSCLLTFATKQKTVIRLSLTHPNGSITHLNSPKGIIHKIQLKGLQPVRNYKYKLEARIGSKRFISDEFSLETNINWTPPMIKRLALSSQAKEILAKTDKRGLVFASGVDKLLIHELISASALVFCVYSDEPNEATELRKYFYSKRIYGSRITVYDSKSIDKTFITSSLFRLVLCGNKKAASEAQRLCKGNALLMLPEGLKASSNFTKLAGESNLWQCKTEQDRGAWTHQYGRADNSTFSGEGLGGVANTKGLSLQWIGRPGGDFGIDRNPRMPAPLAAGGRLFHQGMNRIAALDAANGQVLWTAEIPHLRRANLPRDCSNWSTDGKYLYTVVNDQMILLDCAHGLRRATIQQPAASGKGKEWSFIANDATRIYGSTVAAGKSYRAYWGGNMWYDNTKKATTAKVCSDSVFAFSKDKLRQLWHYKGLIINTTICIADDKVYFCEIRDPDLLKQGSGRVHDEKMWKNLHLVCLDGKSGRRLWQNKMDVISGEIIFYLQVAGDKLVTTSSRGSDRKFHIAGFSRQNGKRQWQNSHGWPGGDHSAHMLHPVSMDNKLYLEPMCYDTQTGKNLFKGIGRREGCHNYIGIKGGLVFRGTSRCLSIWSKETKKTTHWPRLRPSCWLSVIPAQGMLLVPEGGGGCSCAGWMETSMGFAPIGE